ncbi:MAG: extracellular matrix regulator RemB, partial [Oscillospiraceae bacterium]
MYLHLGQDVVVPSRNIVGIFDIENTSISKITKEFLGGQEKKHHVINVPSELPKSFV